MAGILEQLTSSLDEGTITKIGQTIGIDPTILNRGFAVAGPLVLGVLAKKKEGGFLGIGGKRVTEEETAAIQAVASAAGQPVTA